MPIWGWIGIGIIVVVIGVCVYCKVNPIILAFEIIGEVLGDIFD